MPPLFFPIFGTPFWKWEPPGLTCYLPPWHAASSCIKWPLHCGQKESHYNFNLFGHGLFCSLEIQLLPKGIGIHKFLHQKKKKYNQFHPSFSAGWNLYRDGRKRCNDKNQAWNTRPWVSGDPMQRVQCPYHKRTLHEEEGLPFYLRWSKHQGKN